MRHRFLSNDMRFFSCDLPPFFLLTWSKLRVHVSPMQHDIKELCVLAHAYLAETRVSAR